MRFIHTADWHLGRLFHNIHLTEDQGFTLGALVRLADERHVDAVVIAGDIFDRAVPPTEAVDLLDETVGRLALDLKVPVVMIAGNHDSPARLEYFNGLARRAGVHVVGRVGARLQPAEVMGADGTSVRFWPLAYTDPETARFESGRDDIHSHEAVVQAQLEAIGPGLSGGARDVLVAHAFVSGCRESESERPLTVGGSGAVPVSLFEPFAYVALGHLHEPQPVTGTAAVRYAGSLLKYSFNEAGQRKSVTLVELGSTGPVTVEHVQLPVKRDVRRLRGAFEEILAMEADPALAGAYVEAVLTDAGPVLNAFDSLKRVFPHLLSIRREQAEGALSGPAVTSMGMKARSLTDLYEDFFEDVQGTPMTGSQASELSAAIDELERVRREAVA